MKNIFSSVSKKVRNFFSGLTFTAKVKYIVASVLMVAVTISLLVIVSLISNQQKTPTNPKNYVNGETATVDFDNEIIFGIGGESSSVNTTNDVVESSPDTSEGTSGTVEITSSEADTEVSTTNNTETSEKDEPKPTDPSDDNNPDPLPVDTNEYQNDDPEPVDTTNSQTNPKPTETTTKAPETSKPVEITKPTETTAKAPETTKPVETTTKAPETSKPIETTKPVETQSQENPPQQNGQFSLKEKTYDYNGANVSILQVENKSQQAYTITITGKFKDSSGNVIKKESKTFNGFPSGWKNYFVFRPGVKYSTVTWEMNFELFNDKTYAEYFHAGTKVDTFVNAGLSDGNGRYIIPTSAEEVYKYKHYVTVYGKFTPVFSTYHSPINYTSDLVVFDSKGEILCIETGGSSNFSSPENIPNGQDCVIFVSNVLWENASNYKIPDNLKNLTGIMAVKSVTEY